MQLQFQIECFVKTEICRRDNEEDLRGARNFSSTQEKLHKIPLTLELSFADTEVAAHHKEGTVFTQSPLQQYLRALYELFPVWVICTRGVKECRTVDSHLTLCSRRLPPAGS